MLKLLAAALALVLSAPAAASPPDPAALRAEAAEDAYIYAYPLVLMELTRRIAVITPAFGAPVNAFAHRAQFPDDKFTAVVRPNADTLYSSIWFDVTNGPLVIDIPDSGGRYYLIHIMDMWTETFAATGSRTTGTGPQRLAIVGPGWTRRLPKDAEILRSPTNQGWVLGRTQTNGAADYPAVRAFQAGMKIVAAPAAPAPAHPLALAAPSDQVEGMAARDFFTLFAQLMIADPPHLIDTPMVARLRGLGIVPGRAIDWDALDPARRGALEAAHANARARILGAFGTSGWRANGWRTNLTAIGSYGGDYLRRAMIAWFGLGANLPDDATYPGATTDSDNAPLDSAQSYRLHFAAGQLPPVRAFWSLTLYDRRQLFAANPIGRYAIGDRDPLSYNADGSLDLYVQRADPGETRRSNWLPAPADGPFSLTLRLYWPAKAALEGGWSPPPVIRLKPGG